MHIFVFQQPRVWRAVRVDESVHAEIPVVHGLAVVAAVEIHFASSLRFSLVDTVVTPFPDKSAAEDIGLVEQMVIVLEISWPVSHRVAVLTQDHWFVRLAFQIFFDFLQRGVHPAVQIQI